MLHGPGAPIDDLPERVARLIADRVANTDLGRTAPPDTVLPLLEGAITADGLGVAAAWDVFETAVAPYTVALDGPRYLAFIPMSPSVAAVWMDAVVGATSFSAESWLEAAGAVAAENQALDWLRDLAGMPVGAGGAFCSGGSIGNLSAMAVARDVAGGRRLCAVADTAHASVENSLRLLGMESLVVPTGADGRFTGDALAQSLRESGRAAELALVVASAGSTNAGVIDDLRGLTDVAHAHRAWIHVDGAYGGAALVLPECRTAFDGLADVDSFIVDPHKWMFCTAGTCAVLYRDPALARATHTQHGPYIDVIHTDDGAGSVAWNPSDHVFQLTRRPSGLPFWFTLAVHGTDAMERAVRVAMDLTAVAAAKLGALPGVELVMEPTLSVLLFRKAGWGRDEWRAWAADLLAREVAFVAPTTWKGETVGRLVFLHPLTTEVMIDEVLAGLA